MKKKSLFAAFLAGVMAISMMSFTAFAAEGTQTPEIQDKIIIVDSIEDLRWVSDYSNGKVTVIDNIPVTFSGYTIKITNDIANVGDWTPIKDFQGNMTGEVSGKAYATISNINVSVEECAGLCGNSANGKFSNLKIADSSFVTTKTGNDVGKSKAC